MEGLPVTCPSCFELFEVAAPPVAEVPCEIDYDCEVCCRPMLIAFHSEFCGEDDPPEIVAEARGLGD